MRRATNGMNFIKDEDGVNGITIGFALGADFTSEHEWGFKGLKSDFGIGNAGKEGYKSRMITVCPDKLKLVEHKFTEDKMKYDDLVLIYAPYDIDQEGKYNLKTSYAASQFKIYNRASWSKKPIVHDIQDDIATAWDDKSFAIRARSEEAKQFLRDLFAAFQAKDVMVHSRSTAFNVGAHTGLMFTIASHLPEHFKKQLLEGDREAVKLEKEFKASGIEEYITSRIPSGWGNQQPWFALRPSRWNTADTNSKYGFKCWLNPSDQKRHAAGWFTVEELQQWANGEGPVIERQKAKA
jgi:hypothetical protein